MSAPKPVSFLLILGIMLVIFFIVFDIHAQDDHGHGQAHHGDSEVVVIDPQQQVKRSVGVGLSGGDMDINDCLATHVLFFGIWQGTHVNAMCKAARMDRDGDYQAAAEMRCSTKKYQKVYGEDCIAKVIRSAPVEPIEILVGQVPDTDERYAEQQEEIEYLREETASLVGQLEKITQRMERAPTQIDAGAERRAKSRQAYEEALAKGSEE